MDEICRSNIIQRDNVKFAKKLNKELVPLAKEKNKTVSTKNYKQDSLQGQYTVLCKMEIYQGWSYSFKCTTFVSCTFIG